MATANATIIQMLTMGETIIVEPGISSRMPITPGECEIFDGHCRSVPIPHYEMLARDARQYEREMVTFGVALNCLDWVHWFSNRRLLGPIGNVPPVEYEALYYQKREVQAMVA